MSAELTVCVPLGSSQSPSEVCLTGTQAWKVISPPRPVASLEETCNHNQLKLFKKTQSPASPLHCKLPCVSKKYKHSLLCGIPVVLCSPGTSRARKARWGRTEAQGPWQEHSLSLSYLKAFLDGLKHHGCLPRHAEAIPLQLQ